MFYSERSKMRVERLLGRANGFCGCETNKKKQSQNAHPQNRSVRHLRSSGACLFATQLTPSSNQPIPLRLAILRRSQTTRGGMIMNPASSHHGQENATQRNSATVANMIQSVFLRNSGSFHFSFRTVPRRVSIPRAMNRNNPNANARD